MSLHTTFAKSINNPIIISKQLCEERCKGSEFKHSKIREKNYGWGYKRNLSSAGIQVW